MSLSALSEELEKRTRETERLQEEVENATKFAMERISRSFSGTGKTASKTLILPNSPSEEQSVCRTSLSVTQPRGYELDMEMVRGTNFPGTDVLGNTISEYSQQVSDLQKQLQETRELHLQQKFSFRQSIVKLQSELQETQMERDALIDLRMNDSQKQSEQMQKMQEKLLELQELKLVGDQRLAETEESGKALRLRAESMEQTLRDVCVRLSDYEKRRGKSSCIGFEGTPSSEHIPLGHAVGKVIEELDSENSNLQERLLKVEGKLEALEVESRDRTESLIKEQRERMEQLITSHDQEVAMLTEKLNSSQSNAASLQLQVELLQNQAESLASDHQRQMSDVESTLSTLRCELQESQKNHEIKVAALQQELALTQSLAEEAQRGREQSIQQAEELSSQLCQLTVELRQARGEAALEREERQQLLEREMSQNATVEELRRDLGQCSLRVQQLEALIGSLREECQTHLDMQLSTDRERRDWQEEMGQLRGELELTQCQLRQARNETDHLMEERAAEVKHLQTRLEEAQRVLQQRQKEAQQGWARLEEAQSHTRGLRARLEDREKTAELLRTQLSSAAHTSVNHGRSLEALQDERNSLISELHQLRLDNQQVKVALEQSELRVSALETERVQQQAALMEKLHVANELTLEKQQMAAELEVQRMLIVQLKEEQEALKQQHRERTEELEAKNSKLKNQLWSTRTDLDQAKSTLRTLEGADGHGLRVAMGMQKQITAKREQIDFLQGRVQMLEEMTDKLTQEKRQQAAESERQAAELSSEKEKRRRLEAEVETLHLCEKQLRNKIDKLETALHKMSDSFAECQDFIQKQEQEFVCLKLQHALDVKELQGQTLRATGSVVRSPASSPTQITQLALAQPSALGLMELKSGGVRSNSTLELRNLVRELRSVMDEDSRAPSGTHRRSDPTPQLYEVTKDIEKARIASRRRYGDRQLPNRLLDSMGSNTDVRTLASQEVEVTGNTCKELQGKLDSLQCLVEDLQMKNKEMSSIMRDRERKMRKAKDTRTHVVR
ncbi:coiled-coil domain-containing protein 158-like [Chanos chanos]|uniref:Coiled-coil domain-containing protein 158-like n=1 Tax=Chanos chanos TaxID=29144 RepID=A0A6J2WTR7_CHACN|nr:coiled-coil domain-containing protein 158-like [Chanos chanos]